MFPSAKTIQIVLQCPSNTTALEYRVGDHIGILPVNQEQLVDALLLLLKNTPGSDAQAVTLTSRKSSLFITSNYTF